MFVPCPHCGFLVALIVRPDGAPQRCPRCDGLVQDEAATPVDDAGTVADTALADEVVLSDAASIEKSTSIDDAALDSAPATVAPETSDGQTLPGESESGDAATQSPTPTYEDAIAAVTVGATARPAKRAARPRRKGAPSFARHTVQPATRRTHWGWYAGIAALALLFALQLLLAQRHELAADPRWRPLIAGACGVLRCEVPAWREPAAFTMLQRTVRPRPGSAGVLAVEASFRNDARWPQPWPTLVLSLSDVDGRPVGVRAFDPSEYRGAHRSDDRLLPGQSANVTFQVIEPAPRIVAFTFDFR